MSRPPAPLRGLSAIARDVDALICDIWGVLHAGNAAFPDAVDALRRFHRERGPVALLSNAPRRATTVAAQLAARGLPGGCHDSIVTSGEIARDLICRDWREAALFHLGPASDSDLTEDLPVRLTADIGQADCLLVSGPDAEDDATDEHVLKVALDRGLDMICANPDLHVMDRGQRVACAGMLARRYEALGGRVIRTGKPEAIAFEAAVAALQDVSGARVHRSRILVIGDGLATDIRGARQAGFACLHVSSGLPGQASEPDISPDHVIERLCW